MNGIFSKCILCDSVYLTDLDVHLLLIQIYCPKAIHTTDITLHRVWKYFASCFAETFTV